MSRRQEQDLGSSESVLLSYSNRWKYLYEERKNPFIKYQDMPFHLNLELFLSDRDNFIEILYWKSESHLFFMFLLKLAFKSNPMPQLSRRLRRIFPASKA